MMANRFKILRLIFICCTHQRGDTLRIMFISKCYLECFMSSYLEKNVYRVVVLLHLLLLRRSALHKRSGVRSRYFQRAYYQMIACYSWIISSECDSSFDLKERQRKFVSNSAIINFHKINISTQKTDHSWSKETKHWKALSNVTMPIKSQDAIYSIFIFQFNMIFCLTSRGLGCIPAQNCKFVWTPFREKDLVSVIEE